MIFVDTNIVIDVLEPDPRWRSWSVAQLIQAAEHSQPVASAVVVAECAGCFATLADLHAAFATFDLVIEDVPLEAMFAAGHAFRDYRRDGPAREKILADFLIGAHAQHRGARLITRDSRLYRRYFPALTLITPEIDHG